MKLRTESGFQCCAKVLKGNLQNASIEQCRRSAIRDSAYCPSHQRPGGEPEPIAADLVDLFNGSDEEVPHDRA